ncbi:uncharacterized protein PHALS_14885 [Plasmopara halstedii]|uniref:Uncharacterized protein n=1 Tax=Plasmopara halstedii TaxID=4781 RepID=A0A0P1AYC9_PLAHL|nr:uncharacterized protein PHALS_14885 [Plasmopara halstedii]CEG46244.1 hypothetical protein PHALS_14885 [Plasmopara halstedii]|eukprot:XP_024582613.1 hypothetical protein PHALS_14885 [Plasmopara halstedii]
MWPAADDMASAKKKCVVAGSSADEILRQIKPKCRLVKSRKRASADQGTMASSQTTTMFAEHQIHCNCLRCTSFNTLQS